MLQMLGWAWKVFGLTLGWIALRAAIKNGGETAREILSTLGLGVRALCLMAKAAIIQRVRLKGGNGNEENLNDTTVDEDGNVDGEGSVK